MSICIAIQGIMTCQFSSQLSASFHEDAPRPPVPGGGGEDEITVCASNNPVCRRHRNHVMPSICPVSLLDGVPASSSSTATAPASKCTSETDKIAQFQQHADRGSEPDGCVKPVTKFAESTDALKYDEGLKRLLEDSTGVSYFQHFLNNQLSSDVLEFRFACIGFRKLEEEKLRAVALAIFKKFIARSSEKLGIYNSTKLAIKERLKYGPVQISVFDDALSEAESLLRKDFYPLFLNSKEYKEYTHNKSSNVSPRQATSDGLSSPCQCANDRTVLDCNSKCLCDDVNNHTVCEANQLPDVGASAYLPYCSNHR